MQLGRSELAKCPASPFASARLKMPLLRLLPTIPRLVTFSRLPTSRRRFVFEKVVTAGLLATPEVCIIVNARLELRLWTISVGW